MNARLYKLDEIAGARIPKSVRWINEFLNKHPRDDLDRPLYHQAGRDKLLTDSQIGLLIEAIPCPSNSSRRVKAKARTGRSAGRISKSDVIEAQELLGRELHFSNSAPSKDRSNVANFPPQNRRRNSQHS